MLGQPYVIKAGPLGRHGSPHRRRQHLIVPLPGNRAASRNTPTRILLLSQQGTRPAGTPRCQATREGEGEDLAR
ncbi:hypothetical protein [Trebonia kvetii]|uniref:hypothetical protein n=1 Tax=Trebonia kvetii TaxID=2480626 RepID=UPI00319E3966